MNPVLPLLFAAGLVVGLRHRSRAGAGLLLATTTVMCGADFSDEPEGDDTLVVGVGSSVGGYREVCGGAHRYAGGAVTAEYRRRVDDHLELTTSLQVASAVDSERVVAEVGTETIREAGVTVQPLVGFDQRYFALSLGAHMGRFAQGVDGWIVPSGRIRIGPRNLFFVDSALADDFANPLPGGVFRLGVGFGLPPLSEVGRWNHPVLRLGVGTSGLYGGAEVGIGRRLRVDALVAYADEETWRGSIGLKWRPRLQKPRTPYLEPDEPPP